MVWGGCIHVDVECGVGRLVGTGMRVVLEGPKLKIQALERRKPKIAGWHVRGWI